MPPSSAASVTAKEFDMSSRLSIACALAPAAGFAASPARAVRINDAEGDVLQSYTGPKNPDLDVRSSGTSFVAGRYIFDGSFYGAIGSAVVFDTVVIVNLSESSTVRDFIGNSVTALAPDAVRIDGACLEVTVPGALLPSTGFALDRYTYNLWPRNGLTNVNQIADFAPDNSNLAIDVPEPASMAIFGIGLLATTELRRRASRST